MILPTRSDVWAQPSQNLTVARRPLASRTRIGPCRLLGSLLAVAVLCIDISKALAMPPPPAPSPKRGAADAQPKPVAEETRSYLSKREADFRASVSAMVKPLTEISLPDGEAKQLQAAVTAIRRGNIKQLGIHRAAVQDAAAQTLIDWLALRAGVGTTGEYAQFVTQNPLWPIRDRLFRRRLERATFIQGGRVRDLLALFEALPPEDAMGVAAHASAKLAAGDRSGATELARSAWRSGGLITSVQGGFLQRFGDLIRPDDHYARVNALLAVTTTSSRRRKVQADEVRRLLPLIPSDKQKSVAARISVYLDQAAAPKLIAALAKDERDSPHVRRQLAQQLLRQKKLEDAAKAIAKLPGGVESGNPDADWEMRADVVRDLLGDGKMVLAAEVAAPGRPETSRAAFEQAFLAGWLALRFAKKPDAARAHFQRFQTIADGPLTRSRAHYWLGRAEQARGDKAAADAAFKIAAEQLDTFHGALARVHRAEPQRALVLPFPKLPSDASVAALAKQSAIRAGVLAIKTGLPSSIARSLFGAFTWSVDDGEQILLAAQLAEDLGDSQIAVRAGKAGVARGHDHYIYSYPIHRFPVFEPIKTPPEPALILAIARQESEFNTSIVSRAGARGLLQVMPATARGICRNYDLNCNIKQLRTSLSFNAKIAAVYITDQLRAADGNMILTLTSYNAGPGRTRQWLRQRGDPRTDDVDALDWVYGIPFEETRLYVQKVVSNLQVYRARLGEQDKAVRIDADLGFVPKP